jgi:four helix bundle protein
MGSIKSYKDLKIWEKGIEIADCIYEITSLLPVVEKYGLSSQMQRAAVSIPSNIAEGFARQHRKEYQQFCYIALGSCAELETQAIIAAKRKYINENDFARLQELLDHESRMLMNLIKGLKE